MRELESQFAIDMVKSLIHFLQQNFPSWSSGYYRFYRTEGEFGANASCVDASGVSLVGALRNKEFYNGMIDLGLKFFEALETPHGVLLITVKSDFSYDLKFDFDDLGRWKITKVDGASGIPEGEGAS